MTSDRRQGGNGAAGSTARVARVTDDERGDIQGFLTSGYGHLPHATYLFVHVHDAREARRWLARAADAVASARPWPTGPDGRAIKPAAAANIAFTAPGLRACGLPESALCTFPVEFTEGIVTPQRSRILGDTDESDPAGWELGGARGDAVHAVVMLHATNERALLTLVDHHRATLDETSGGVVELADSAQHGRRVEGDYEPFGFHDGISQPSILGIHGEGVPTGEFVLGYENHYGLIPPTPVVPGALDPDAILPSLANPYYAQDRLSDLGRNGSFVVYRKLHQDVAGFWRFMTTESIRVRGRADAEYAVWLASKCVGRWPSGAPLTLAGAGDDPGLADRDAFLYEHDRDGRGCPLGAHIRRANPRDVLEPYPAQQSLNMTAAHRLLRRARVFGPPLFDPRRLLQPAARDVVLGLENDGAPRGIHFFCVNASLKSQFEFVQQNWCNNPRFGGLNDNKDPLVGDNERKGEAPSRMTIPTDAAPYRTAPLPRFVTVRAGAYFFMPSLRALRFLAAMAG